MAMHSAARWMTIVLMTGALACARNTEETGTVDETGGAGQEQNPEGYRGMERDTAMVPETQQEPVDTFLQQQGTDPKADTAGYGGFEQPREDTGEGQDQNQAAPQDEGWTDPSAGGAGADTSAAGTGADTSGMGDMGADTSATGTGADTGAGWQSDTTSGQQAQ